MRFVYVPGVTPGKWINRWRERLADVELDHELAEDDVESLLAQLDAGEAQLAFIRVPGGNDGEAVLERLKEGRYAIPLYEEQTAVVAAKGHEISAFDELDLADVADETFFDSSVAGVRELGGLETALEVVASGAGLMLLPMPAVRHMNNGNVVARVVNGADQTRIVLVWPKAIDSDEIQEFVGIVRGRRADSGRQPSVSKQQQADAAKARKKRSVDAGARGSAGRSGGSGSGARKGGPAKAGGAKGAAQSRGRKPPSSSGRKPKR